MLEVDDLHVYYGEIDALEGVTIRLARGGIERTAAAVALSVAHRGYVLETGRVTLSGAAAELQEHPEVRRAYLGQGA